MQKYSIFAYKREKDIQLKEHYIQWMGPLVQWGWEEGGFSEEIVIVHRKKEMFTEESKK